jgi:exodeoxyribonuclease VII large subunit
MQTAPKAIATVSELTQKIKTLLENGLDRVEVEGEINGLKTSANGHLYLTLKDEGAQISSVAWRGVAARIKSSFPTLQEGSQVVARGRIQVYAPRGSYQLVIDHLEEAGLGKAFEAIEKLKQKLKAEGLFDESRKKPLPPFPHRIGVITSAGGAALHDITSTLEKRWPLATVMLHHAAVQGEQAAAECVRAVQTLDQTGNVDVIILGRGGGSTEDLMAFNDEALARTITATKTPVVSAVGHETDFSISDFVADARAATPTKGAVLVTPHRDDVQARIDGWTDRLTTTLDTRLDRLRKHVTQLRDSYALRAFQDKVGQYRQNVSLLTSELERLNPETPLKLGYTRVQAGETWVRNARDVADGGTLDLIWHDGAVEVKSAKVKSAEAKPDN